MQFNIDTDRISLADLRKRIEESDLVPSRLPLLEGIEQKFFALESCGLITFRCLRDELKTGKRMEALSNKTGIGVEYLVLLRREIESYLPKPARLSEFDWLPRTEIAKLEGVGIQTSADLYEAADKGNLEEKAGVDAAMLDELVSLVDLTRVQWTSPVFARVLSEASYDSVEKLASARPEELHEAIRRVNEGGRLFKGQLGLRDVKRLIKSAGYLVG